MHCLPELLASRPYLLMEAAVVEPIRRSGAVALHPTLVNAPLIYSPAGRAVLESVYGRYLEVAAKANEPLLLCTPTWRANRERVEQSGANPSINQDAVAFLRALSSKQKGNTPALIGGLIGCKQDCYRPEEALSLDQARAFHRWQVDALAHAGVDVLIAETLPAVCEAAGIAQAMAETNCPYIISFVIDRSGRVLDGTPLLEAIEQVDRAVARKPLGYLVNCVYPSFLCAETQPPALFERLIGIQANASSLDHCELDNADELSAEPVAEWGALMLELHRRYGLKILGGCCGTDSEHLRFLATHLAQSN